ncbi:MAG: exodeoxyribonuclease VII small subunit [Cyanobacteria bacterium J06633_2]
MSNISSDSHDSSTNLPTDVSSHSTTGPALTLPEGWNYETTVEQIEEVILRIETGEMELADIFDQFAIAVDHLRQCESFLDHHRQQVDLLIETLAD